MELYILQLPESILCLYPLQTLKGYLQLLLPVDIPLLQPNAKSVLACNAMIITFMQLPSVKLTLLMPIHHALYWKKYLFCDYISWIKNKQRDILYHCNCKLYLWFRQSFAKRCKTHSVLKLPHLWTARSKSKAKVSSLWQKLSVPEYCHSILLSLQFVEGQVEEGIRDAQLQNSPHRHCLQKVPQAKLKGAVHWLIEILHTSCLADLNGCCLCSWCYCNSNIIPVEGSLFYVTCSVLEENLSLLSQAYIATCSQWI